MMKYTRMIYHDRTFYFAIPPSTLTFENKKLKSHFEKHIIKNLHHDSLWKDKLNTNMSVNELRTAYATGSQDERTTYKLLYQQAAQQNIEDATIILPAMFKNNEEENVGFLQEYNNDVLYSVINPKEEKGLKSCFFKSYVIDHYYIFLYYYHFNIKNDYEFEYTDYIRPLPITDNPDFPTIEEDVITNASFEANYINHGIPVTSIHYNLANYCFLYHEEKPTYSWLTNLLLHYLTCKENNESPIDRSQTPMTQLVDLSKYMGIMKDVNKLIGYIQSKGVTEEYDFEYFYHTLFMLLLKKELIERCYPYVLDNNLETFTLTETLLNELFGENKRYIEILNSIF